MFTAFKQSIKALSANPARTVLTTLGIMIGISTVILVLSAGAGFRSLINAQVDALGSNTLFIQTRVPPTTKNRAASTAAGPSTAAFSGVEITSFKQRDLDDIAKLNNVSRRLRRGYWPGGCQLRQYGQKHHLLRRFRQQIPD